MPAVVERALQDIDRNELWRARERLEGYIGSTGYDRDVVELLGDVCYRMGDHPNAGRYWFFTPADSSQKQSAIETFVRRCGGAPRMVYSNLPRTLRDRRPTQYPPEVRHRLDSLREAVGPRAARKPRRKPARHNPAGDALTMLVVGAIALFFLFCFGLGFVQLMKGI
jgi:hypothetical protein